MYSLYFIEQGGYFLRVSSGKVVALLSSAEWWEVKSSGVLVDNCGFVVFRGKIQVMVAPRPEVTAPSCCQTPRRYER